MFSVMEPNIKIKVWAMLRYNIHIKTSESNTRHFPTQKLAAEWLNIKGSSKKALTARCNRLGDTIEFDN